MRLALSNRHSVLLSQFWFSRNLKFLHQTIRYHLCEHAFREREFFKSEFFKNILGLDLPRVDWWHYCTLPCVVWWLKSTVLDLPRVVSWLTCTDWLTWVLMVVSLFTHLHAWKDIPLSWISLMVCSFNSLIYIATYVAVSPMHMNCWGQSHLLLDIRQFDNNNNNNVPRWQQIQRCSHNYIFPNNVW